MENFGTIKTTPIPGTNKMRIDFEIPVRTRSTKVGIEIVLPLFGDLTTMAENESEIQNSIDELLTCYVELVQRNGHGLKAELKSLGWRIKDSRMTFSGNHRDRRATYSNIVSSGSYTTQGRFAVNV